MQEKQQTLEEAKISFYLKFIGYLMDQVKLHGLNFILLALAVMWFYNQNEKLTAEVKLCNSTMIDMHRSDKIRSETLLLNSTAALQQNTQAFKEITVYLKNLN